MTILLSMALAVTGGYAARQFVVMVRASNTEKAVFLAVKAILQATDAQV